VHGSTVLKLALRQFKTRPDTDHEAIMHTEAAKM
jgi:hypothetical protein